MRDSGSQEAWSEMICWGEVSCATLRSVFEMTTVTVEVAAGGLRMRVGCACVYKTLMSCSRLLLSWSRRLLVASLRSCSFLLLVMRYMTYIIRS